MTRDDFKFWETVQVRWNDMDAMGHVNNSKYFTYAETARMAYFRTLDLHRFKAHDKVGPGLVSATCNFKEQVAYPATLEVGVRCAEIRTRSIILQLAYYRTSDEKLVADGQAVMVWVDYSVPQAVSVPHEMVQAIEDFEGRSLRAVADS